MRHAMIIVPILFLIGLVALGYALYQGTESNTACVGAECGALTEEQFTDRAIEAQAR